MSDSNGPQDAAYDSTYAHFDSPLMRRIRSESYGKDIAQHSWVTAEELDETILRLGLTGTSRVLDVGCGPGGPLTYVIGSVGCHGVGTDVSAEAVRAARDRASSLGLGDRVSFHQTDSNEPMPFDDGSFDAVIALDVILHLRDRTAVFHEIARVLKSDGRFYFTDAGVLTGVVSDEDIRLRSIHGFTQFAPPGCDEQALERAGFHLIGRADKTSNLRINASGRLAARLSHRAELAQVEDDTTFERQKAYLETVLQLAERGAVSRVAFLAAR